MIQWLHIPIERQVRVFTQISEATGLPLYAVEKDWWVVRALEIIFELPVGQHLVFKGGTSLSKAWNLIERFSEDIDLAIDREFLGFSGELKKKEKTELRKTASRYTSDIFLSDLKNRFAEKGFKELDFQLVDAKDSDQDPRVIQIYYPSIIDSPGYIEPRIQIEIGCRSLREPFTIRSFGSLIDEHYSELDFAIPFINVPTVNPERTFLEKIFLLHEEFQRPHEKRRVERLSRHLYDIYQLSKTEFVDKAFSNPELYNTIVEHRFSFAKVGGVNYNLHQPQTINPIPPSELIKDWEADYKTMYEQMIYEADAPSFKVLINTVLKLKEKMNALDWKLKSEYPIKE